LLLKAAQLSAQSSAISIQKLRSFQLKARQLTHQSRAASCPNVIRVLVFTFSMEKVRKKAAWGKVAEQFFDEYGEEIHRVQGNSQYRIPVDDSDRLINLMGLMKKSGKFKDVSLKRLAKALCMCFALKHNAVTTKRKLIEAEKEDEETEWLVNKS
jgi:hypothetical protein